MARPRALLLVRNTFTHDARVLRAAHVLRDRGFDPLVVAVMSTEQRTAREVRDGIPVLRLDPTSPFTVVRRWVRRSRTAPDAAPAPGPAPVVASGGSARRAAVRLHRWLRTLDFYRRSVAVVRRERPALVHCNDYNTLWIGAVGRLLTGTKVLYDSHELWPDRNGRPEPRWWLLACEALLVRCADAVVTASPGYADVMARRYRMPRPAVVRNVPSQTVAPAAAGDVEPDLAVYAGGLLRHRGLEQAIGALAEVPELRLRLIGPGHAEYVAALERHAQGLGVADRLEIRAPVAPGEVGQAVRTAAFGLALFQPVCLSHRLVAPNKLFEYVAAGVPTLASDLPVLRAFVDEHGVGVTAPADDAAGIARAARTLLDPEGNRRFRERAAAAAREITWDRERLALEQAYDRALATA